jgi:indoleamine 2,3-dioxygenase
MATAIPNLEKFGLSKTLGFLSDERPLKSFPNSYFAPWDQLVATLPEDTGSHEIGHKVRQLPILDSSKLTTELEYRRAYVVLAFIIHGYIWSGSADGKPLSEIPPSLSEPFLPVCEHLGLQPVLSYAGLCLWNWAARGDNDRAHAPPPGFVDMMSVASFTGTRGEDAFYYVPVMTEVEGGPMVSLLLHAVAAAQESDAALVANALNKTADMLGLMVNHLPNLTSVLDPDEFYHKLRPFFGAGSGNEDKGLPRGVVFRKSDGSELEVKCIAGTAGQSALFQFLDMVLGVEHKKPEGAKETFFQVQNCHWADCRVSE